MQTDVVSAWSGYGAVIVLLREFVAAPREAVIEMCVAQDDDEAAEPLVLVCINKGHRVAMTVAQTRKLAAFCLDTKRMPTDMQDMASDFGCFAAALFEFADKADEFRRVAH